VSGRAPGHWGAGFPQNYFSKLRPDSEDEIARKRAAGRGHHDFAGGCAGWHRGLDFRIRDYIEGCRRTVKADVGRARQIGSQDNDLCSHLAESRQGLHERTESHIQAKDCAAARVGAQSTGSASLSRTVEGPVGSLNQPIRRRATVGTIEAVQRGHGAFGGHSENRAGVVRPTRQGCSVKVPVNGLVKVCPDEAIAVAAQNRRTVKARLR
jgi:hypothetical protein